jgi:hypothetical protein
MNLPNLSESRFVQAMNPKNWLTPIRSMKIGGVTFVLAFLFFVGLGIYWSQEPELWSVEQSVQDYQGANEQKIVGVATALTTIEVARVLLNKPGGYMSNDLFLPPSMWLDNIKYWEKGVIYQVQDITRILRSDIARSQSTSIEDVDLKLAESRFRYDPDKFMFESTESQFEKGIMHLEKYLVRMTDEDKSNDQFYARADNLASWLDEVRSRLGSYSQRLSASVDKSRLNTDLSDDTSATQSTYAPAELQVKTPFFEIDDVFYEARGYAFATALMMHATALDFEKVLKDKNALVSYRQTIRELEATQETLMSPMVLNGSGFGMFANHSLVMANYISRANAAVIDLIRLLEDG